jgi:hypothetical protein
MPRGVVGDSMDRATDKMDQMISRSKGTSYKKLSILDQLKQAFPDTWEEELKRERQRFIKRSEPSDI